MKEVESDKNVLYAIKELNKNIIELRDEIKKSNSINEKFLLLEKKKTLLEKRGIN